MIEWAESLDSVALSAFLDTAPVVIAPGQTVPPEKPEDTVALSANLETVAATAGVEIETVKKYGEFE